MPRPGAPETVNSESVFVALSKLLDLAVAPLTWALVLGLVALLPRGSGRARAGLGAAALLVLVVFSSGPAAAGLTRLAEAGAPRTYRPDVVYDVAVVLSGMVDADASAASGEPEFTRAADRIVRALELVREGRVAALLLSGGAAFPRPGEPSEPERLRDRLVAWGVPADRIAVETASRNTRENAVESAKLLAARGARSILLVTSAAHAPRALGCFRAVGLSPDVLPVDHRAGTAGAGTWLPRASALETSTSALRELAGRAVYYVLGYTR